MARSVPVRMRRRYIHMSAASDGMAAGGVAESRGGATGSSRSVDMNFLKRIWSARFGLGQKMPATAPVMATEDMIWAMLTRFFQTCEPPGVFSGTMMVSPGFTETERPRWPDQALRVTMAPLA